jgi:hypothetical protein
VPSAFRGPWRIRRKRFRPAFEPCKTLASFCRLLPNAHRTCLFAYWRFSTCYSRRCPKRRMKVKSNLTIGSSYYSSGERTVALAGSSPRCCRGWKRKGTSRSELCCLSWLPIHLALAPQLVLAFSERPSCPRHAGDPPAASRSLALPERRLRAANLHRASLQGVVSPNRRYSVNGILQIPDSISAGEAPS